MTRTHRRHAGFALAVLPLALIACGGDDGGGSSDPTAPADATLTVEALNLKFDKTEYTATAGPQKIAYLGIDAQRHNLVVLDANQTTVGNEAVVDQGEVDEVVADLAPGSYTLICTVPGHSAAGMKATLTVS